MSGLRLESLEMANDSAAVALINELQLNAKKNRKTKNTKLVDGDPSFSIFMTGFWEWAAGRVGSSVRYEWSPLRKCLFNYAHK